MSCLLYTSIEAAMRFTIANGMVAQTAGNHYPAPITAVKTIEAAARFGREAALNPVSYTHLDVYKRQGTL